jgi:hypothetical protein
MKSLPFHPSLLKLIQSQPARQLRNGGQPIAAGQATNSLD